MKVLSEYFAFVTNNCEKSISFGNPSNVEFIFLLFRVFPKPTSFADFLSNYGKFKRIFQIFRNSVKRAE